MNWETVIAVAGGIVLLGNVVAALQRILSPGFKLKSTVEKNCEKISRLQKHEQNDFEALEEIRSMSRAQCNIMMLILNHMIDGNHVEEMKKTRERLQELLANIEK